MKVTDTYLAEITDFGLDGKGFSKIEDIAVFTPYTAAGDLAKIKIKKVYKGVAEADAVKIVRPASCRVVPPCKTYGSAAAACYSTSIFRPKTSRNENSFKPR